jgi:hypothetical protein
MFCARMRGAWSADGAGRAFSIRAGVTRLWGGSRSLWLSRPAFAARYRGMASPPRKRRLSGEARRALELLAGTPDGVNEALLLAHGFTRQMLTGFVRSGLATWHHKTVRAGGSMIEVNYMMITDAGWEALGES